MNAQRIKILHACHCKAVIVRIADHLKLNLFPALQRLFYQNLFRESKRTFGQFQKLFFIGTNTAAESSQCISRTNHHRIANASRSSDSIFHALHRLADRSFHLDFIEFLHKQVTVFRIHNSLNIDRQYKPQQQINNICIHRQIPGRQNVNRNGKGFVFRSKYIFLVSYLKEIVPRGNIKIGCFVDTAESSPILVISLKYV